MIGRNFVYSSETYRQYRDSVRFISGEWGVTLPLLSDEASFRKVLESNN